MEGLEACDDANTQDGDGCSAACEHEHVTPACVKIVEAPELRQGGMLATDDGLILVGGDKRLSSSIPYTHHGWIGAFDTEGKELWTLDLGEGYFGGSIIETGDGFRAVVHAPLLMFDIDDAILSFDAAGTVSGSVSLTGAEGFPRAILETEAGLLLGGAGGVDEDLWLGRLSTSGELATVMTEDYAGLYDIFIDLERSDDAIGALALVGTVDESDGDVIVPSTEATLLVEYDQHGAELRRTLLSESDEVSLVGSDLAVTDDGTWIIAGMRYSPTFALPGTWGWAAAVRDGEVLWMHEAPDSTPLAEGFEFAAYDAVAVTEQVQLLGGAALGFDDHDVVRLGVGIDAADGSVLWQDTGEVIGGALDRYVSASTTADGTTWLLGTTSHTNWVEQWLCSTQR
ncbi:hypothetical protein ENSA5_41540 [Enhygromyxa salina]|uniref:Uncharacterized protein n=1 Tax=Enhygromyxa salina TaxID=215803 RepID=A0A2S9XMH3_9BACT|nr:hypothetical protein ENSA5_41540 [Enhygromyxa salina]